MPAKNDTPDAGLAATPEKVETSAQSAAQFDPGALLETEDVPEGKDVVQITLASVNLKNGNVVDVKQGEKLPAGLADGERERLDRAGVFTRQVRRNPYSVALDALNATPSEIPGE